MFPYSLQDPPPLIEPNLYLVPTEFAAGDTFIFKVQNSTLYPSSAGWSFQLSLRGGTGGTSIDITSASPVVGDFLLQALPAVTVNWPPGTYNYQLFALNTGQRTTVQEGFITIEANLAATATSVDTRTHAARTLDLIEALIEGRAADDIIQSTIDQTHFLRMTPEQLLVAHSYYTAKVRGETARARAKAGLATGRTILTRFVRPM